VCAQINKLSRYTKEPRVQHIKEVVRTLQYLGETKERCIRYAPDPLLYLRRTLAIDAYSDSDWGSDLDSRHSTTGSVVLINGAPVVWQSKRQKTIAQSSTEAEYMAITETGNDAIWVRSLLKEIRSYAPECFTVNDTINMWIDNQSATALTKESAPHQRSKHIDIRYHLIRQRIADGDIKANYISTHHQLADALTKRLPDATFHSIRDCLLGERPGSAPITLQQYWDRMDEVAPPSRKEKKLANKEKAHDGA
jgi:hypothetical protein